MLIGHMLLPLALALAPPADTILSCSVGGAKRIEVTSDGTSVTYRYGRKGRPEITLTGNPASGTLFYHGTTYLRAEDQTLRFVAGNGYEYIVYSRWQAPTGRDAEGLPTVPEYNGAGVVVMYGGKAIARLKCRPDGMMHEWPVFFRLPKDEANRTPDDA